MAGILIYYFSKQFIIVSELVILTGGIRGTVVACWTAGLQVERSILHQEHDSKQNSSHYLRLALQVQHRGLKHHPLIVILKASCTVEPSENNIAHEYIAFCVSWFRTGVCTLSRCIPTRKASVPRLKTHAPT